MNEDGLSYSTVLDIEQEFSGIMWFATKQGLNKYDSYNIKKYYYEDNLGLPSNVIQSLLVSKNNKLFIGTDKGLVTYEREIDKFKPIFFNENNLPSISSLVENSSGTIIIGTSQGIYAYYENRNKIIKFVSLQEVHIHSICELYENQFLVTSGSGLYIINSDGVLLEYYNKQNTPTLPTNIITVIYKDRNEKIWIGTDDYGLFQFDKDEKEFSKIKLSNIEKIEENVIRDILEDDDGNIWIASELGVYILDKNTNKVQNIRHSLEKSEYHLNDNAAYCLFQSKENIMWIGTYFGGVNYTNLKNQKGFYNIYPGDGKNELKGKAVSRIFKTSKGTLWIATEDGGICSFNTNNKRITKYFQYQSKEGLSSNNIHSISEDKDGRIWFGHFMTGIDIYEPTKNKFKHISLHPEERQSIGRNSVYSIYKDTHQKMWIGTQLGVYTYDDLEDKIIPFKQDTLGNNFIYNIMEDRTGKFWFCIRFDGIVCYNPENEKLNFYRTSEGLSSNQVVSSIEDKDGRIWFGTIDGGVNIYHSKTDSFEVITMEQGLPNNTVYGIVESNDGNMWLSTNRGLALYNYESKTIRNYNLNDGLAQMQFNYSSYFKDSDGTLYFGHINGLTYFNPKDVSDNSYKSQVILTDFKISNESIKVSKNGILTNPINDTKEITLSYLQKAFTIDFVAINHFSSGQNQFYYYLEGFEETWNEMGNQTSATYTNLSPGKYSFWLKAKNNDGIESANIKKLEILIQPPFYLTGWAYSFYITLLVAIFLLYRKITIDKEKEKAALNCEIIEKEKIKELSQQRLNFYTYISHEFKTPLSIIISSIEQLYETTAEISDELRSHFQRLSRSSKRLSFLFNQLMDFRKIETKHAKLILQKGDIVIFLKDTCLAFTPLFNKQRVNFEFKSNQDFFEYYFDPDKIEKIIVNLISNALKNTPVHGKVLCEANILDDENVENDKHKSIIILISDNGTGIPESEIDKLFIPFYEGNERKNGSGIGLTLVKSLVEYLHGTIELKSKENLGTDITIKLPLYYDNISNVKLENSNELVKRNLDIENITGISSISLNIKDDDNEGKEFKLLIVEDTVDFAEVLIDHYKKHFQICTAQNGIQALKMVGEEEPDIIISDIMMPEMDGIEFCKRIKQDEVTSHIAVILLTAKSSHEDKIEGLQAGAEAYITKPFDLTELDLHVRNFLEIRKKLKLNVVSGLHIDFDKLNFQDKDKVFIENVTKIINENIENVELNTEGLAKQLGMSKTLVYLKLKKLLNMSGSDLILSLRFNKAIELMANVNLNVSDIAYEVGFSDPNYFSKVFKKVYKKTPTSYRKELLEKINNLNTN